MADLDKNRHNFLQTLRSFDSKLKPSDIVLINESTKDIIIGELTCPMEVRMTYWHETKTKYHDLAKRIAEKGFTVLLKLAVESWLESHCANSSLHWNFRRRLLKKLSPIAQIPHCIGTSKEETLTDCANSSLHWNFQGRNSHRLRIHCTEMLPKDHSILNIHKFSL